MISKAGIPGHGPNQPKADPQGLALLRIELGLTAEASIEQVCGDAARLIASLREDARRATSDPKPMIARPSFEEAVPPPRASGRPTKATVGV